MTNAAAGKDSQRSRHQRTTSSTVVVVAVVSVAVVGAEQLRYRGGRAIAEDSRRVG